ncbi:MAG: phosphatase PAP2 family protein [Gammaproteobacteria bacterium]|nr:phosphatase PAP2 family protein [Gammaproteobacteria bacterium]
MNAFLQRAQYYDTQIFLTVNGNTSQFAQKSARIISRLGDGPAYFFIGLTVLYFDTLSGSQFFQTTLLAFTINVSSYLILKNTIKRDRPAEKIATFKSLIQPSDKFSFPSGHTAAAFVFASMFFMFYGLWSISFFIFAFLVGLSRILLGVHYPGDIAAGAFLGIMSSAIAIIFEPSLAESITFFFNQD